MYRDQQSASTTLPVIDKWPLDVSVVYSEIGLLDRGHPRRRVPTTGRTGDLPLRGNGIMPILYILAGDGPVSVESPPGLDPSHAARYATMAYGASVAKRIVITDVRRWVAATFRRACGEPTATLDAQMGRWASATRDRYALLGPVCDLILLNLHRVSDTLLERDANVPDQVRAAVVTLIGHDVPNCVQACPTCRAATGGDWARALRTCVGDRTEVVAASICDAYRAARRGGHIRAVSPMDDVDGFRAPAAPAYPSRPQVVDNDLF